MKILHTLALGTILSASLVLAQAPAPKPAAPAAKSAKAAPAPPPSAADIASAKAKGLVWRSRETPPAALADPAHVLEPADEPAGEPVPEGVKK